MDLVCSFPTCRNGGIKFLYCLYCDDVIAKRTFRTHHSHEDEARPEGDGADAVAADRAADISDDSKRSAQNDEPTARKRRKKDDENANGAAGSETNQGADAKNVHEIMNESDSSSSPEEAEAQGKSECNTDPNSPTEEDTTRMRAQWDALLDERQEMESNDDISDWLDRVVSTSERYKAATKNARLKSDCDR
jgi:hypothetical protein